MPVLDNPKHETYAYHLAKGLPQKKAYVQAGFTENASAASRLAASPYLKARVEEIRNEIYNKMNSAVTGPEEDAVGTLAEMGLTIEWCASAYKKIYQEALSAGQLAPANTAVSNIQKLVEIKGTGDESGPDNGETLIKVSEVNSMLDKMTELAKVMPPAPIEETDPADMATDITPADVILGIE